MAKVYGKISTVTVGSGGAANIEFTSIPTIYTDLLVKFSIRDSRASAGPGYLRINFNDSGSSYSRIHLLTSTDGSSAGSTSANDDYTSFAVNIDASTANTFCNGELYIPNYRGSNNKSVSIDSVSESNTSFNSAVRDLSSFLWSNTAAITKITLYGASNFKQYSSATLYGIRNTANPL